MKIRKIIVSKWKIIEIDFKIIYFQSKDVNLGYLGNVFEFLTNWDWN